MHFIIKCCGFNETETKLLATIMGEGLLEGRKAGSGTRNVVEIEGINNSAHLCQIMEANVSQTV